MPRAILMSCLERRQGASMELEAPRKTHSHTPMTQQHRQGQGPGLGRAAAPESRHRETLHQWQVTSRLDEALAGG